MTKNSENRKREAKKRFGTFGGVFTPSVLTILGVIMFLRSGYVVGRSGVYEALFILFMAESIAVLSAFSIAAVATNMEVKGGGAYYMISRTLGPQFGGSIGIALYLAQALSIPFYILGFTQAFVRSFPLFAPYSLWIALLTCVFLFVVNFFGAALAVKTQYIVMTILALSIVSFLGGAVVLFQWSTFRGNCSSFYEGGGLNIWTMFAVFFPAVTGILAGVNMSGDLKNPSRSLVRGTFAAIFVGILIYLSQIILTAGSQERGDLIEKPYQMLLENALFGTGFLVAGGVLAATLSSALGSFLGAPRILQALARDRIFPGLFLFAKGRAKNDEPVRALFFSFLLSFLVIIAASGEKGLQKFDMVASVVTMFFLCTYGMINFAAFFESFGKNPSFRPGFRHFHWSAALLGSLLCLAVMVLINVWAALVAIVLIACIYLFIERLEVKEHFSDARGGFLYSWIFKGIQRLQELETHSKNWRPAFLVLSGNPKTRPDLVHFGVMLEAQRGFVTIANIIVGEFDTLYKRREAALKRIDDLVRKHRYKAFPEVIITQHFEEGLRVLVQAHSLGPVKVNTVLFGWPHNEERLIEFVAILQQLTQLKKSVVCMMNSWKREEIERKKEKRIDIWWRGMENGSLMCILAHLLVQNPLWSDAKIRLVRLIRQEEGRSEAKESLLQLLDSARIAADAEVLVSEEEFGDVLRRHSGDAAIVLLGFKPVDRDQAPAFFNRFESYRREMPPMVLVWSNGDVDLLS